MTHKGRGLIVIAATLVCAAFASWVISHPKGLPRWSNAALVPWGVAAPAVLLGLREYRRTPPAR